jgi:transcriptional regulator with XRE-family HTH domain
MNLKNIRLEKGLTVPQLVKLSGVHRRTIQDIEKRGDCKISTALKLANALNVSLDELIKKPTE